MSPTWDEADDMEEVRLRSAAHPSQLPAVNNDLELGEELKFVQMVLRNYAPKDGLSFGDIVSIAVRNGLHDSTRVRLAVASLIDEEKLLLQPNLRVKLYVGDGQGGTVEL
jgi:hypothetical protein